MESGGCFENYPLSTVALANLNTISIPIIGLVILSGFGVVVAILYIAFSVAMTFNVLGRHCVDCYYYGKTCFSGWGKVSSRMFKRGNPKAFAQREVTWLAILPDFLTTLFPVFGGIVLLASSFAWTIVGAMVLLLLLSTWGNSLVRGRLACRFCKQRCLGCPAERLFQKGPGA